MDQPPEMTPLELAKELLIDSAKSLGCDEVKELRELSYQRVLMSIIPEIRTVLDSAESIHYEIENSFAQDLAIMGRGNVIAFEIIREICASNIASGKEIPEPLRPACILMVRGEQIAPHRKGRIPGKTFAIQYAATRTATYLCDAFNVGPKISLQLTRNDGGLPISAADIVREALKYFGLHYSYETVRDWTKLDNSQNFTLWAHAVDDLLVEESALNYGLIERRKKRILNPWGQYAPIVLSTKSKH